MRVRSIGLRAQLGTAVLAALMAACSGGSAAAPDPSETDDLQQRDEVCFARFTWLQKDAYKETAGRSDPRWPPHTTTRLDAYCGRTLASAVSIAAEFRANHGTAPEQRDANGEVFLTEMKHTDVRGTRAALLGLVEAYADCECDATTQFLAKDSLKDEAVKEAMGLVAEYLGTNLRCEDGVTVEGLVDAFSRQDLDAALTDLSACTFADGSDLGAGFDQAFAAILQATNERLSGYHVCNNDAELQAELFARFGRGEGARACESTSALCRGPRWLYNP